MNPTVAAQDTARPARLPGLSAGRGRLLGSPENEPVHRMGVFLLLVFLYTAYSRIIEFLPGAGIAMALALAALVPVLTAGDLRSALTGRTGRLLIAFTIWAMAGVPFSIWMGGAFGELKNIWVKSLLFYFLFTGGILTFRELRKAVHVLAFGAVTIVALGLRYGGADPFEGRFIIGQGVLSNANDLAVYLLIGLPFCAYAMLTTNKFLKPLWAGAICMLLMMVVKTASRGAMLAVALMLVYLFFKSRPMHKVAMICVVAILLPLAFTAIDKQIVARWATTFSDNDGQRNAATSSKAARLDLLKSSLIITAQYPVFGVGMGNFSVARADETKERLGRADWHVSHNMYTQLSSEVGIPGFLFYMAAVVFAFRSTGRIMKLSEKVPEMTDLYRIAFALRMSWLIFLITAFFASVAYGVPIMILLAMSELLLRTHHDVAVARPKLPREANPVAPGVPMRTRALRGNL